MATTHPTPTTRPTAPSSSSPTSSPDASSGPGLDACRSADPGERRGRPKRSLFTRFSQWVAMQAGRPATFVGALVLIAVWAMSGPLFGFGDTWQLVINTSTTIVTFLMVFVIQNSQNRDTAALHIKLDELIARTEATRNVLLDLEELDDRDLEKIRAEYEELARREREKG